ncbi:MAG: IPT/TIG domain-containing protein [Acidobacteriota bacterium]|nr:IPT/TIG domain-containing protein [Acidobacteriota bacterium]
MSAVPTLAAQNQVTLTFRINPSSIQAGRTRDVVITTDEGLDLTGFTIEPPTDTDVTIESQQLTGDKQSIVAKVKVNQDAETETLPLKLVKKTGNTNEVYLVNLAITEFKPRPLPRQAVPEGIPQDGAVDYLITPMAYKAIRDNYGRRVADAYCAVVVTLGNNTGFDMQIVNVGFDTTVPLRQFDESGNVVVRNGQPVTERQQISAFARTTVRASVERDQQYGQRALALNLISGFGTFASGFLPFFHAINPRANFASFSSILNGQLREGFGTAFPDVTIRHLNRLENNEVLHDEMTLPNNQATRITVFVPRQALNIPKTERDNLPLIRERLGNLILVGRPIKLYANREIVVRTGAGGTSGETNNQLTPRSLENPQNPSSNATSQPTPAPSPAITRITPNSGPTTGAQETFITISGFNTNTFETVATVKFGDMSVAGTLVSPTLIRTISPSRAGAGAVDVEVTVGNQKAKLTGGYSYLLTADRIEPASGPLAGGGTVTILGHGFVTGARVLFGSIQATNVVVAPDGNSVTATVPPTQSSGNVIVKVINPDGAETVVPGNYTYNQ